MTKFTAWQRALTLALCSFFFVVAAAQAQNPYDKFRDRNLSNQGYLSEEEEIKLAEQVHQQLINPPQEKDQQQQAKPIRLLQGTALNTLVERLGQKLARDSKRPNIPWRFYVVDDDSLNAFATLGGRVYVHTGLIKQVQSEAQLASVIGHEIGHIVGRHGLENVKRAGSFKTQGAVIGATILGAILGGQQGAELGQVAGSMVAGGFLMKHSREAEREADYLGLYNLERTGYNTGGMVEMFEILSRISQSQPNALGSILASHPAASERAANTRREIADHLRGSDQRGASNTNDFQRVKGQLPAAGNSAPPRKVRPRG